MVKHVIRGTFTFSTHAEDDESALTILDKLVEYAEEETESQFDYEVEEHEEEDEMERCESCSKKVTSTELEQNDGICYVCANPNVMGENT